MCTRATIKSIKSNYNCYAVGYCELYNLLCHLEPEHYTIGTYGWNADIYILGMDAIVVGYRPFGKQIDHSLCKSYEERARKILKSECSRDKIMRELKELLKELMINAN